MTIEEHQKILQAIKNSSDPLEIQQNLLALEQDYTSMSNDLQKANEERDKAIKEANGYIEINKQLWEQKLNSNNKSGEETPGVETPSEETPGEEVPKKMDLTDFNFDNLN